MTQKACAFANLIAFAAVTAQEFIATSKKGDAVEITYAEALAMSIDAAK